MTNPFSRFALTALLALASAAPAVAALPSSGPTSTVVYVSGSDLVLKASDGSILNYTVPAGYKFTSGGKQVMLADLKPGAALTAPVSTGVDPQVIASIAVTKAKVYAVTPPDAITLILSDGSKDFTVPSGVMFSVGGAATPLASLKPDTMVDVTLLTPAADANPVPPPATPPLSGALLIAKTEDLPSAGTNLPLYGIAGLCMVLLGVAFLSFRKRAPARRQ
jgi:LPXTG-motif cell wall-anchored protein